MSDETPRKVRGDLSRQQAKRIENLIVADVKQRVGAEARRISELEQYVKSLQSELRDTRYANARLQAVLEAMVRRHGRQMFDKQEVIEKCGRGRVQVVEDQYRFAVELPPDLEIVSE